MSLKMWVRVGIYFLCAICEIPIAPIWPKTPIPIIHHHDFGSRPQPWIMTKIDNATARHTPNIKTKNFLKASMG